MNAVGRRRFLTYTRLSGVPSVLQLAPQLESWDKAGASSQVRLAKYLTHVADLIGPLPEDDVPLSLELIVGLDPSVPLLSGGRDLDNYLYPIVKALGWRRFSSAFARKRHGSSSILVGTCHEDLPDTLSRWQFAEVRTTSSTASREWKDEIIAQVNPQVYGVAQPGPVDLQLCFRVRALRNWADLWKPAIDSLGAILGEDARGRPYRPNDDRVVNLRLHRAVDESLGNAVEIGIWWRNTPDSPGA